MRNVFRIAISFVFLVLCVSFMNFLWAQEVNTKKIDINFENQRLYEALTDFSRISGLSISYEPSQIDNTIRISKRFVATPINVVFEYLLEKSNMQIQRLNSTYILRPKAKIYTISGRVVDRASGENIVGATITLRGSGASVQSNGYGFFSLSAAESSYEIIVSHISYKVRQREIQLDRDYEGYIISLDIAELSVPEIELSVNTKSSLFGFGSASSSSLNWERAKLLPFYKAEADVLKALQMTAGVTEMYHGSDNLLIRGGGKDQNLILLDDAIIYNTGHLFGINSIFNPDAIKNIQVHKDAIPASFGGRLSSVVDIRMTEGNKKEFHAWAGTSLLASRFGVEGPIVKDKGSFIVTSRNTLFNLLKRDYQPFGLLGSYSDFNTKLNYSISEKDEIYYSLYWGRDKVKTQDEFMNKWGNLTSTLRWNHIFNPKLFFNFSFVYSNYKNNLTLDVDDLLDDNVWITGIRDKTIKGNFTYYKKSGQEVQFGALAVFHEFIPGESTSMKDHSIPRILGNEYALYGSEIRKLSTKVRFDYGIRLSGFQRFKERSILNKRLPENSVASDEELTDIRLEPRTSLVFEPSSSHSIRLSYNRGIQYMQLIQNEELSSSSLESWIPVSRRIHPQESNNFSIDYSFRSLWGTIVLGSYYKQLKNQVHLTNEAQLILNPKIESQLLFGRGKSYGTEFSYIFKKSKLELEAIYAWARALKQIEGINNGEAISSSYDIPHTLKLKGIYEVVPNLFVSSYFTIMSGRPARFPIGFYDYKGVRVPVFDDDYQFRMPTYHRADMSIDWKVSSLELFRRKISQQLSVSLFNVYNMRYPLMVTINQDKSLEDIYNVKNLEGTSFGLRYTIRF